MPGRKRFFSMDLFPKGKEWLRRHMFSFYVTLCRKTDDEGNWPGSGAEIEMTEEERATAMGAMGAMGGEGVQNKIPICK